MSECHGQVLRIERESEEVTVFYRPNTMRVEELSRNPVANALAVTFLMPSEQVSTQAIWRNLSKKLFANQPR